MSEINPVQSLLHPVAGVDLALFVPRLNPDPFARSPIQKSRLLLLRLSSGAVWALYLPRREPISAESLGDIAALLGGASGQPAKDSVLEELIGFETGLTVKVLPLRLGEKPPAIGTRNLALEHVLARGAATGLPIYAMREEAAAAELAIEQSWAAAWQDFLAQLEPGMLALGGADGLSLKAYNYLCGEDGLTRRNRLQAHQVYPMLTLALAGACDSPQDLTPIRIAIDAGKPLFAAIASAFGVPCETARSLSGQTPTQVGEHWTGRLGELYSLLSPIPPEHRPKTAEAWSRFNAAVDVLAALARRPVKSTLGQLWLRSLAKKGFDTKSMLGERLPEEAMGALEAFRSALTRALKEMALRQGCSHESARARAFASTEHLLLNMDAAAVCRLAMKWQADYAGLSEAVDREIVSWPPMLDGIYVHGEINIIELACSVELADESRCMNHCVEDYVWQCQRGESNIFSLRDPWGKSLSTLELKREGRRGGSGVVKVAQHLGKYNRPPSKECEAAVRAFVADLNANACQEKLRPKQFEGRLLQAESLQTDLLLKSLAEVLPPKLSLERLVARMLSTPEGQGIPAEAHRAQLFAAPVAEVAV